MFHFVTRQFYQQLAESLVVLLLVFGDHPHHAWIAELIMDHKNSLFSVCLPLVFHQASEIRLKSLQLLAVLLFDRGFLYQGKQPEEKTKRRCALQVPGWFRGRFEVPTPTLLVEPTPSVRRGAGRGVRKTETCI